MSISLSPELLAQMYSQESGDPFLTLLTLTHPSLTTPIRVVSNSEDIISRGETFKAFPFIVSIPSDDGEKARQFKVSFDNVSRELITLIRSTTTSVSVLVEMVLASQPDIVQLDFTDLKLASLTFDAQRINMLITPDDFLSIEFGVETYNPVNFAGIF